MLTFEVSVLKIWKQPLLFCAGGAGYVGLEFLWRGWSHASMFLAGGSCFLLLGQLQKRAGKWPLLLRALAGAGVVTAVELVTGLIANRNYSVWDYRALPLNLMGQVCLLYSFLWMPVSLAAMAIYKRIDGKFR